MVAKDGHLKYFKDDIQDVYQNFCTSDMQFLELSKTLKACFSRIMVI